MSIEIYGTFGPACKSQEILEDMIRCGMTGMRLNLSHTTLEKSKDYIQNYRIAARNQNVIPQILIDMQGPELRVGDMEEMVLKEEELVELGKEGIPVPLSVISALKPDMEVLLDDGKIRIHIEEIKEQSASARIIVGGILKPHKSMKIVDVNVEMPVLTEHDIKNLRKAREYGVTALMQPFVFSGEDLKKVRAVLKAESIEDIRIFAKIENRIGVDNLENILPEADMIVIARGDLGNDMPFWELPRVQKKIENICKRNEKPYMVVTQMLASMELSPIPTRAEVSDIFHAVLHGAGAVMVTGETAVGKYPVEVMKYLTNTAEEAMKYRNLQMGN